MFVDCVVAKPSLAPADERLAVSHAGVIDPVAQHGRFELLDQNAPRFVTAAIIAMKRVDVPSITLRLGAEQAHLRQAVGTQKQRFYALGFVHNLANLALARA